MICLYHIYLLSVSELNCYKDVRGFTVYKNRAYFFQSCGTLQLFLVFVMIVYLARVDFSPVETTPRFTNQGPSAGIVARATTANE